MTSRRDFLGRLGAGALAAIAPKARATNSLANFPAHFPASTSLPPGELLGSSVQRGHRLLQTANNAPDTAPDATRRTRILIIGGGIAGLSAAWQLHKSAVDDYLLLEMEEQIGGNSRAGSSPLTAYPWGAHYLPLPGRQAIYVRQLLAELGVLHGPLDAEKPTYDERFLCATPQERVFRNGWWEEGLLPHQGVDREERAQQQRFQQHMEELKDLRGKDGRRVFNLPMADSSRDAAWRALDRQTFSQWLNDHGYTASTLHWLANYACRDDYGTAHTQTSAWAGLHYFACRNGLAANAAPDCVLTAPDGNAWLARGLARHSGERILCNAMAWRIEENKHHVAVDVLYGDKKLRIEAQQIIWASPMFILPRLWAGIPDKLKAATQAGDYAPWLTANLHLSDFPEERQGAPLSWDNVFYDSPGLGYVVATHQLLRRHVQGSVLTYYRALHDLAPAAGRRLLLETPRETWAAGILQELERVHPNIRQLTSRLDVFRNGHAMLRPAPGALFHGQREIMANFQTRRMTLAHADLSGFSLFEEAQYRGVLAARRSIAR